MKSALILWRFSRPHTVIGSIISICTLYAIVCKASQSSHFVLLSMALLIGITCNLFIVGINQIADVGIDKINKPYLPLASGELSISRAKFIVLTALICSLGLAIIISPYLFAMIALSAGIGWAYSMPPFYLRRHHLPAALAITVVRGLILNIGGFLVFAHLLKGSLEIPGNLIILTIFIVAFSVVISWFKDLPDVRGDKEHNIKSFAILYSSKTAFLAGNILVSSAYLFSICMKLFDLTEQDAPSFQTKTLLWGHVLLLLLFLSNAFSMRLYSKKSIVRFYKRFWWFFFAEYLLYLIAYL
jgi:homogentisate phytyltransferase / homogentisate geranylgeranyltransferase